MEDVETNVTDTMELMNGDSFMDEVQTYMTFKITTYINNYWFPILVPVGLIGNTLSFLVMIKPNNRKMSTCIYMAAISINDNLMMFLALYSFLVPTLRIYPIHWIECKVAASLAIFGLQNSTFQVLAMTLDKYIAIKWPYKAAIYSTPRRAKITVTVVLICTIIYNLPQLYMAKLTGDACLAYAQGGMVAKVYSWLSFVVNAVIPFTLLIYMNHVIVKKVRSSHKMFGTNETHENEKHHQKSRREQAMKNTENQLTIMLLLVTILFVILMIPTYLRFVYTNFAKQDTPFNYASFLLFYHVSQKLYHTNNGINFFLYCISGQKFRNDLKEILGCNKEQDSHDSSSGKKTSGSSFTDTSALSRV